MVFTWLLVSFIASVAPAPQSPTSVALPVASLKVDGAHRYSEADVIRLSGLAVGQAVTPAVIVDAGKRLSDTGLFKSVRYRYQPTPADVAIVFEIEEPAWTTPVILDNFVWFTDDELMAAVRKDVPSFDGMAPAIGGFPEYLTRVLQRVLDERKITGQVEFRSVSDLRAPGAEQFLFRVRNAGLRMCSLEIEGASAISQQALLAEGRVNLADDYSRLYLTSLSNGTFLRMYHLRGYLRAAFLPPTATLAGAAGCQGMRVVLHVNEGSQYVWDHAQWSGQTAFDAKELDKILDMRKNDPANLPKIEAGLHDVETAFGAKGYVTASVGADQQLDEATKRATFNIAIVEGPQYRMGVVEFAGLSDADLKKMRGAWRLRTGDPYDATYLGAFMGREGFALKRRMTPEQTADSAAHVVNVRLTFGAPTPALPGGN